MFLRGLTTIQPYFVKKKKDLDKAKIEIQIYKLFAKL
jgi:hypothetical protein